MWGFRVLGYWFTEWVRCSSVAGGYLTTHIQVFLHVRTRQVPTKHIHLSGTVLAVVHIRVRQRVVGERGAS